MAGKKKSNYLILEVNSLTNLTKKHITKNITIVIIPITKNESAKLCIIHTSF